MPMRSYNATAFRFGFNNKEKDDEAKGTGNQIDYGMRTYDPRLGKFLSVDPMAIKYPWYTPYQFAGNKPIAAIDIAGLEEFIINQTFFTSSTGESVLYRVDFRYLAPTERGDRTPHSYLTRCSRCSASEHLELTVVPSVPPRITWNVL